MKEVRSYKLKALPNKPITDAILYIKADGDTTVATYITDVNGLPYPLTDEGGIKTITNTDGTIVVIGLDDKVINLSTAIKNLINSALQSGDNISELFNDSGYITAAEVPPTVTNLQSIASSTNVVIDNNNGTSATVLAATTTNAGVLLPGDKIKLDNTSNVNSGDQTSIVGISGTKIEYNSSLSDGDFLFVGDVIDTPDATTTIKGKVKLAGDLAGTADLPTVPGLANKADLVSGKVPSSQLPSYVDDVLEGYLLSNVFYVESSHITVIPAESGKIYIDLTTGQKNKEYRYSGSNYIQITNGLIASTDDVPEGSVNRYFNLLTEKATIVDNDKVGINDSESSNSTKFWKWSTIKGVLNTLYQSILVSGTNIKTLNGLSLLGSGNINQTVTYQQTTDSLNWIFIHNLNTLFPNLTIWDSLGNVLVPKSIIAIDSNTTSIVFTIAKKGTVTASGIPFTPIPAPLIDPDAQAFISAVGTLDSTNQNAINQLVLNLKSYGLWSKLIAFYPKAGSTASEHKWNLKDPRDLDVAYRQIYSGSIVHSVTGVTYNSTNTFTDTKLNLNTLGLFNNFSMGVYITVIPTNSADVYFMGAHSGSNNFAALQKTPGGIAISGYQVATPITQSNTKGMVSMSILGQNRSFIFNNNILETTGPTGTGVPTVNIYEGAINLSGRYGSLAFTAGSSFIGYGLYISEVKNLYTCILAYETALSRN